jgi:hypothetical protein
VIAEGVRRYVVPGLTKPIAIAARIKKGGASRIETLSLAFC